MSILSLRLVSGTAKEGIKTHLLDEGVVVEISLAAIILTSGASERERKAPCGPAKARQAVL